MGTIRFLALGAGQDVGRSCIVVTLGGRNVMFDCGMHMGYNDSRRFPDFTLLSPTGGPLDQIIDAVIITHFHLDHCGALPYLTEMCGYNGPVFMTHPTKALCPILLEDYRRITVERKGEVNFFTLNMIRDSLDKVIPLQVEESHFIGKDFEIKPFYAGHVLGAAMFYVRVGGESVLYTGDYNMTPDRHLGAASVELSLRPDILITESTYATTLRDSKRARERDFLRNIHQCVAAGGKVLIPVFALGRVQELCILVEAYWDRMGLSVPVYFSAGMAETANSYYRVFIDWTNERLQAEYPVRNLFDFRHVRQFERHYADHPGPMVLFSSPGMLHSGMSLEIFKKWCGDEKNLLIIPGFCVSGTVGAKVLSGQRRIEMEEGGGPPLEVRMQVKNMSFSAHADARGIMQMIRVVAPRNVILVHGEASKMTILKSQIIKEFGIPCFDPPNGQMLNVESAWDVPVRLDGRILKEARKTLEQIAENVNSDEELLTLVATARASPQVPGCGCLSWKREDALAGIPPSIDLVNNDEEDVIIKTRINNNIKKDLNLISKVLQRELILEAVVNLQDGIISCRSIKLLIPDLSQSEQLSMEWRLSDTLLAQKIVDILTDGISNDL